MWVFDHVSACGWLNELFTFFLTLTLTFSIFDIVKLIIIIGSSMTSPTFLNELPENLFKRLSLEDIHKIHEAEKMYWDNKPYTKYFTAFNGSRTKNGGLVRAVKTIYQINGISLALVGDEAIYPDGSTAKIISGAGSALTVHGRSAALVGSRLENNDEIIDTPINNHVLRLYHDQTLPDGFMTLKIGGPENG